MTPPKMIKLLPVQNDPMPEPPRQVQSPEDRLRAEVERIIAALSTATWAERDQLARDYRIAGTIYFSAKVGKK